MDKKTICALVLGFSLINTNCKKSKEVKIEPAVRQDVKEIAELIKKQSKKQEEDDCMKYVREAETDEEQVRLVYADKKGEGYGTIDRFDVLVFAYKNKQESMEIVDEGLNGLGYEEGDLLLLTTTEKSDEVYDFSKDPDVQEKYTGILKLIKDELSKEN